LEVVLSAFMLCGTPLAEAINKATSHTLCGSWET